MRLIHLLLINLVFLIAIVVGAILSPQVAQATGVPHPEIAGMMVREHSIYDATHTKILGLLWGLGIISLMVLFLLIGNRKNEKLTAMAKWLGVAMTIYVPVFFLMIYTDWNHNSGAYFTWLPVPTAWMVYGVWFVPLIITFAYYFKFESCIISPEEEKEFMEFLEKHNK